MTAGAPSPSPRRDVPHVVVDRRHRPWAGRVRDRRVLQLAFDGLDRRRATIADLGRIVRRALP